MSRNFKPLLVLSNLAIYSSMNDMVAVVYHHDIIHVSLS